MHMNIPKIQLEVFFKKRNELINQLSNNEIDKIKFLEKNYELIQTINMKPLLNIQSIEEGMYNYQYYNILAKFFKQKATLVSGNKKKLKKYNENIAKSNNYYVEKDKQLLKIVELVSPENMEAYYVEMFSKRLNNTLFEIVLNNVELAIFHSKNENILKLLKEKGVFSTETKKSKIDDYINSNI